MVRASGSILDFEGAARPAGRPTRHPPRSAGKLAVLMRRAAAGRELFNKEGDAELADGDALLPDTRAGAENGEHGGHVVGILRRRHAGRRVQSQQAEAGAAWQSRPTYPSDHHGRVARSRGVSLIYDATRKRLARLLGRLKIVAMSQYHCPATLWAVCLPRPDGRVFLVSAQTEDEARAFVRRGLGLRRQERLPAGTVVRRVREE